MPWLFTSTKATMFTTKNLASSPSSLSRLCGTPSSCRSQLNHKTMKEFKYTINGKEYNVEIGDINEQDCLATVIVNGETFEVGMEKPAEPEKKKVELGKPVAEGDDQPEAPAANTNTANATKAPQIGRAHV